MIIYQAIESTVYSVVKLNKVTWLTIQLYVKKRTKVQLKCINIMKSNYNISNDNTIRYNNCQHLLHTPPLPQKSSR